MKKTFIIATLCLILDQVVKNILLNIMMIGESKAIIKNFFNITLVQNDGAAFSTFRSNILLLIIISLKKEEYILYGILMGGIAGNLIDRVIYQSVTDFLDFNIFGYPFPIFNIADICIVISMFGLALIAFKEEKRGNKSR